MFVCWRSVRRPRNLNRNGPDKTDQFASDRRGHGGDRLAGSGEFAVTATQSHLPLPCRIADRLGEPLLSEQLFTADPCGEAIAPGCLYQHSPGGAIACFRYAALTPGSAAGMFRGDQAEIGHELAGILKARDVAEFCDHGCGRDQGHPAKRLQGVDHWRQSPVREHGLDLRRQLQRRNRNHKVRSDRRLTQKTQTPDLTITRNGRKHAFHK